MSDKEGVIKLADAMEKLEPLERRAIGLFFHQGKDFPEIACELALDDGDVARDVIHKAMLKIEEDI